MAQRSERLFISVAGPDRAWARWIGQELRRAGYVVELDEWSWRAGSSFFDKMEHAISAADRMIIIMSPAYFSRSTYGREEREAALQRAHDVDGFCVPVVVAPCDPTSFVGRLSNINLVGFDEIAARQRLLDGVRGPQPPHLDEPMPWPGGSTATPPPGEGTAPFPGGEPPSNPGSGRQPSLTVLHLSELRLGLGDLAGGEAGPESLAESLCDDLQRLGDSGELIPDILILTGDIAENGRRSEYDLLHRFLEAVLARLRLPLYRVAIVPGERDVNLAACRSYFDACEAEEIPPASPYWPKWRFFEAMFTAMFKESGFAVGQEWSLFAMADLKVVVAGLNSTISCSHLEQDRRGFLGAAQADWFVRHLVRYRRQGWLRIGVVHHNPVDETADPASGIADPEHMQAVSIQLNLLLHGHGTSDAAVRLDNGGLVLSTGSAALGEAMRYQVLKLGRDTASAQCRAFLANEHRWVNADGAAGPDAAEPGQGTGASPAWPAPWESAEAAFPVIPEDAGEGGPGQGGGDARMRLKTGDSVAIQDRFIARAAEVARIRYAALGEATVTQIEPTVDSPGHLRVTCQDGMIVSQHPVGVVEGDPNIAIVDRFVERVHRVYAATDAQLASDLVFGGNPAPDDLRDYARRQGVRLVSFIEYQGLLDLRDYLRARSGQLERDPLYPPALYMPQRFRRLGWSARGQLPVDASGLADNDVGGTDEDALVQVIQWLTSDQVRLVLLLGDFGRGKTFLLHELALRLPEKMPHVVPMLIELRHLDKAQGIDQLVAAHLLDAGVGTFDQAKFRYMLRQGRIVLLFDGFDELALRITYERATEHLDTLLEAVEGQARVVLTSRTQHFRSDRQIRTALDHRLELLSSTRVAILEDFTDSQIEQFLSRHYGGDEQRATARMELIRDVRDLLGLARNPRMLGFIARLEGSRLRQVQARTGSITSADLYQELLRYWLEHEARRARPAGAPPTLTAANMWTALTALAIRLWQTTDQTISPAELADTTGRVLTTLDAHGLNENQIAHQLGSGTLLVRAGDDAFRFVHASVMEYLVAFASARWLRGQGGPDDDLLGLRTMSPLMVDFVVGLAGRAPVLGWTRGVLADPSASNVARINALAFARSLDPAATRGARLADSRLEGLDLSGLDLAEADLTRANLAGVRAAGTSLRGAKLRGAILASARLVRTSVAQADLAGADLSRARLTECDFSGTLVANSTWTLAALLGCTFDIGATDLPPLTTAAIAPRDVAEFMTSAGGEVWAIAFSPDGQLLAYAVGNSLLFADLTTWSLLRANADHTGPILSLVYTPDGSGLVTGSGDGTLRLWNVASASCRLVLLGHDGQVRSVVMSPDGMTVASGSDDGTVRLWDTATGSELHVLQGHDGPVRSVVMSPDGMTVASGSDDGTVRLWDTATGNELHVLEGHDGPVQSVAFSPNGTSVASGGSDSDVVLWDVSQGSQTRLAGHRGPVISVAFSPDGTRLASGDDFAGVRLWDDQSYGQRLDEHRGPVISVVFSPDGSTLASGSYDGTVRLWDTAYGSCRQVLAGHQGPVWSVVFSPDGSMLASGGDFGTLRLWDTAYGSCRQVLDGSRRPVLSSVFSPDGALLASANGDGTVRLWDTNAGRSQDVFEGHSGPVSAIDFSPDGALVASASADGTVRLWDTNAGRSQDVFEGHSGPVSAIDFSPDGALLASTHGDGTVRLWDTNAGRSQDVFEGHSGPVSTVRFSPDGMTLATGGDDRSVRLWDLSGEARHTELAGHRGQVHAVAFSPDGSMLASCSYDGTVRLWDPVRGTSKAALESGGSPVRSVAFSPDGRTLVSIGDDSKVRLWDTAGGVLRFALTGHSDWIWSAAFSPDSGLLATGCDDGTVRLWNVSTGECMHLLHGHRGWVRTVHFSPDGKVLASGGHDGTIRLHDVASGSLSSIMVGLRDKGWATHRQDETYAVVGAVGDEFWWAIKLCRFDTGELDPYVPAIRHHR